jgi:hypothetical protein
VAPQPYGYNTGSTSAAAAAAANTQTYGASPYGYNTGLNTYGAGLGGYNAGLYGQGGLIGAQNSQATAAAAAQRYNRNVSYQPVTVAKDYGLWEKYYRLEVETFESVVVTDTENVWVIAYIDPSCGGCKRLSVEYERLTTVEQIRIRRVKFGYVDVTVEANASIIQRYTAGKQVQYTPTIFLYGRNKYAPTLYEGNYSYASLSAFITTYCDHSGYGPSKVGYAAGASAAAGAGTFNQNGITSAASAAASAAVSGQANNGFGVNRIGAYTPAVAYKPAIVRKDYGLWARYYRLEVETFTQTVINDTLNAWVVAYIDPACGGCKRLSVEYEKVTTVEQIKVRRVKFGYVDITVPANRYILDNYTGGQQVLFTPTVFLYGANKAAPVLYEGDYKADSLTSFICGFCDNNGYGVTGYGPNGYGNYQTTYTVHSPYGNHGLPYGFGYNANGAYDAYGNTYGIYGYNDVYAPATNYYGNNYGYGYGYNAQPQIVDAYQLQSNRQTVGIDYDQDVLAGRQVNAYETYSVEPAQYYVEPSYGYVAPQYKAPAYGHGW